MPIVNGYKALCGGKEYNLREGDVLIIGPCMLHELFAPESGERIIFQPCLNQYFYQGAELAYYDY